MALKKLIAFMKERKKVETFSFFPCQYEKPLSPPSPSNRDLRCQKKLVKAKSGQKGVAMIIAILVTSMMFAFMADMIINSAVSLQLAVAHRDNIKAEYLAKSGKNLALFLLSMDLGIDLLMFKQSKKLPTDGLSDIWTYMNGMPIGESSLKMLVASGDFKLNKVNDSKIIDTLENFHGTFVLDIKDEKSKINVNFCAIGHGVQCLRMLRALMSCPAEREFLDRKKLTPMEVAANIKDWVDTSKRVSEGSPYGSESDPYDNREPKVRPKNAPFDSLDELKMVAGWDDEMHKVFAPYLTVHPLQLKKEDLPQININSVGVGMMSCLVQDKGEECREKSILSMLPPEEEDRLEDVSGVTALKHRLDAVFCDRSKETQDQFTYRSDVFRAEITGEVGDQTRRLMVVIKRGLPDGIDKKNKFKGAYKFLEWKMY